MVLSTCLLVSDPGGKFHAMSLRQFTHRNINSGPRSTMYLTFYIMLKPHLKSTRSMESKSRIVWTRRLFGEPIHPSWFDDNLNGLQSVSSSNMLSILSSSYPSYHNSTSSFAALATQSSLLSQSASALFDRDHPSMTEKVSDGINFRELTPAQLQKCRSSLGLKEWSEESS